ncbi:MAG: hypothetical protein ACYCQJ_12735 [Nitrososphaerales archaeon]
MPEKFTKVSFPSALAKRVERLIREREDLGYTSVSSFIQDATRQRLEALEKYLREDAMVSREEKIQKRER